MLVATGDDRFVELPQQFLLAFGEVNRGLHEDAADEIADNATTNGFDALATDAKHFTGLSARGDLEHHLAIKGGYLHLPAEGGGDETNGDLAEEMVVLAGENGVALYLDLNIEIARGTALIAGLALASKADAVSGIDASGELNKAHMLMAAWQT